MLTVKILPTPENYDNWRIKFKVRGEFRGFGYIAKADNTIGLIRCPDCGKENYARSVASGQCLWCGFDVHTQGEVEILP